jgi:hypothetical protein
MSPHRFSPTRDHAMDLSLFPMAFVLRAVGNHGTAS